MLEISCSTWSYSLFSERHWESTRRERQPGDMRVLWRDRPRVLWQCSEILVTSGAQTIKQESSTISGNSLRTERRFKLWSCDFEWREYPYETIQRECTFGIFKIGTVQKKGGATKTRLSCFLPKTRQPKTVNEEKEDINKLKWQIQWCAVKEILPAYCCYLTFESNFAAKYLIFESKFAAT